MTTAAMPVIDLLDEELRKKGVDISKLGGGTPAVNLMGGGAAQPAAATGVPAVNLTASQPASPYAGATAQPSAPPAVSLTSPTPPPMAAGTPPGTPPAVDITGGGAGAMKPSMPAEPTRADFPAQPLSTWRKILGAGFSTLAGLKDPNMAGATARAFLNSPQREADEKFQRADADWKEGQAAANTDLNRRNVESEISSRDQQTAQREKDANAPAPEKLEDITKEFSDALARGDQARIDALAPRVKQYLDLTKPPKEPAEKTPTTAESLRQQIDAANAKGDTATVKALQKRLKDIDPNAENRLAVTIQGQKNAADRSDRAADRADTIATRAAVRDHDKAYVQPAEAVEKSYQMMDSAYKEYQAARKQGKDLPTGAQSMLALSTHLSTTFGNVKGARITKDMIEHHLGARGISDSAVVAVQKLTNGDVLSPDQWEAFHNLIGESRKLSWKTAVREGNRKKIPIDFLPDDLQSLKDGTGGGKVLVEGKDF